MFAKIGVAEESQAASTQPIRVMSFNIRYGTANDGANHWDKRKEFLLQTIQQYAPDLLGTQETLAFQKDYLADALPNHEAIGVGREDGKLQGEMTALFYRKDRFNKISEGHFWLSETPEKAGSKSWDSSLPRMVSFVVLKDKSNPQSQPFLFLNTHFDHRGEIARAKSAELIVAKASEIFGNKPAILTGDFNTAEGSQPYLSLFGTGGQPGSQTGWFDTYRVIHPHSAKEEGTFSGFLANNRQGPRIDWIACTKHWTITGAAIDHTEKNGQTPSDHFPVTTELEIKSPE
jgi:endonuclease/exonuclease/phosphatase family metal-dependent hydrolase